MPKRFTVRQGYRIDIDGAPAQQIEDAPPIAGAALLGTDLGGLRARLAVSVGDRVAVGQILFVDRARPAVAFAAPVSGEVVGIDFGPRRALSALRLRADAEQPEAEARAAAPGDLRETLLSRGMWPAFRTRPFGRIPAPDGDPAAIFVTAIDTRPLAPDPAVVLTARHDELRRGVAALAGLTSGPVFVCQGPGPDMAAGITGAETVIFEGPHPAGLAGTHVHRLFPASPDRPVWTIGYQDVAAIGHLQETGCYDPVRVVSLAGPRARRPRLLRTRLGASLHDISSGELAASPDGHAARLVSGSPLDGREAAYLGRHALQVSLLDGIAPARSPGLLDRLLRLRSPAGPMPIVPTDHLEHALAFGMPPVPLLRALAVGDAETAGRLGALHMIEEDVALVSALCTSGADYGALLRQVLEDLAEAA
ncbi:MAG: NADH:ubiquinone reductase (Na(+)-transporting) subunit A [Paracoccaceae bacterium]